MPGKVKVKIISGKNLPVMDRSSDTTDAYVEIKLGNTTYKTEVCRRTLHPQWNSEWYRFEVDDSELQDEPLQIRLMDHDTYSANDAIGKVYLNLNPLLLPVVGELRDSNFHHEISGWIPVYDTMHGIRGEVNVTVKVELFSDFNRFRQSSCGVHFFYSTSIPVGYQAKIINGFVEELIVDDDPEYQWIDKIRTPRASNEARQTLFFKLSGELQRKIGVKALALGANAVIGYRQCFDLEGESGIVARGIGTAVYIVRAVNVHHVVVESKEEHHNLPAQDKHDPNSEKKDEISPDVVKVPSHSPLKSNNMISLHRRSSDSDLSITPKGNSLTGSDRSVGNTASYLMRANYFRRGQLNQDNFDMLEYPFLTMSKFPSRFIVNIAGSINARSVKLLERISNVEEPESRDTWWSEIRMEIRSHARSLNCNAVLGYTESTSICEDVCVLSACGTAAVIDFACLASDDENMSHVQFVPKTGHERDKFVNNQYRLSYDSPYHKEHPQNICSLTHLPFDGKNVSMKAKFAKCLLCHKARVPEVLVATIEPPDFIPSVGKGCFIEGHVLRHLKDLRGETIAKEISDGLPFLEYELHRLLINKLKIKGMNAIFGLQIRITVGEKMIVGVAAGTAMYVSSLPTPDLPMLVTNKASDEKRAAELQNILHETVKKNKELYQIKDDNLNLKCFSDDESDEEMASLDLSYSFDSRDCYILEMDDPDDAEVVRLLVEDRVPSGFHIVNTEMVPGLGDLEIVKNLQMFTQIYRAKLTPPYNLQSHFTRILQSVYFKLRRMVPCALCDLQFRIALPEPDEVQLYVIGMALGLGKKSKKHVIKPRRQDEELIFNLDEDHPQESPPKHIIRSHPSSLRSRTHRSPSKTKSASLKPGDLCNKGRHGVDITPLSYVPGANIEHYLGNLNFFFIRETTSIREEGGLSGFIHSFVTEVLAIVRSHVTALGGNALVAFFMTECVLNHSLHKNQGQCLINVGGDVVSVSYNNDHT
ncbi:C2 domain-containing protein 5 isoform X2 [Rhynchophorus ferrugineus]|uniref:C2 domain-containing protein 5 isoform X2 n=1 Tax=Rhynchophorus ferrugineus TaxID=354439 RepID=UPI003FCE2A14